MQRILTNEMWKDIHTTARKARRRKAAIAYVTKELVPFRKGDVLVVNASPYAIRNGDTNAKLLRSLQKKGVSLYDCPHLHAKVLLLDEIAVIGSGNMSQSSLTELVEAGVMTDHASTAAAAASFIEQLKTQSTELSEKQVATLCRIKVVRGGSRPFVGTDRTKKPRIGRLGTSTWLVSVREIKRLPPAQERFVNRAVEIVRHKIGNPEEDPGWLRWGRKSHFPKTCREGDRLIQIFQPSNRKDAKVVLRSAAVLLKKAEGHRTWFFLPESTGSHSEMLLGRFRRMLRDLGYSRKIPPRTPHRLDSDVADAIKRKWRAFAK